MGMCQKQFKVSLRFCKGTGKKLSKVLVFLTLLGICWDQHCLKESFMTKGRGARGRPCAIEHWQFISLLEHL